MEMSGKPGPNLSQLKPWLHCRYQLDVQLPGFWAFKISSLASWAGTKLNLSTLLAVDLKRKRKVESVFWNIHSIHNLLFHSISQLQVMVSHRLPTASIWPLLAEHYPPIPASSLSSLNWHFWINSIKNVHSVQPHGLDLPAFNFQPFNLQFLAKENIFFSHSI